MTRLQRVLSSPAADDLRRYGWLIGLTIAGVLYLAWTRDSYVTWGGFQSIPTGGAR